MYILKACNYLALVSSLAGGDPAGGLSGSIGLGGTIGLRHSYSSPIRSVLGSNFSI